MSKKFKKETKKEFAAQQRLQPEKMSGMAHQEARQPTKVPQDAKVTTPRLPFSKAGPLRWLVLMLCCSACSAHGDLDAIKPSRLAAISAQCDNCSDDPAVGHGTKLLCARPARLSQSNSSLCELRDLACSDGENVTWVSRITYKPCYMGLTPEHEEWIRECALVFNETGWKVVLSPHAVIMAWNELISEPDGAFLWWIFMAWIAWLVNPGNHKVRRSPPPKEKRNERRNSATTDDVQLFRQRNSRFCGIASRFQLDVRALKD